MSASFSVTGPVQDESASAPTRGGTASQPGPSPSREGQGQRDRTLSQQQLAVLDPTLRVDLLERSKQVNYAGESRNIFQFYTPPPPEPVAAPVADTPSSLQPPPAPAASDMPLKFYGVASRPGTAEKKAFLTDGEEIYIGEEGDLIAKRYKIIRIGVNSIELEDNRDKRRQQLPLLEE